MIIKIPAFFIVLISSFATQAQLADNARQLIYHEKFITAETLLHDGLKTQAGDASIWYLLGQAYLGQDRLSGLKDTLASAPAAVMDDPIMKSLYGHLLLRENDTVGAAGYFDAALKATKMKNAGVLSEVAAAHIDSKAGNAAYALELLEKAKKRDKANPALYVLEGDAYRKLNDGGNAFRSYLQALEKDPSYAAADYKLGKIYTSQHNPESYLPYFNKAVAADSQYTPALYELYYHYYFTDLTLAATYLDRYIAAAEPNKQHSYLKADMLYASKKYDEAVQQAAALIKLEGADAPPRLFKLAAYSLKEKGDNEQAGFYMNTYFSRQPDTAIVAKDFEAMGDIYAAAAGKADSAAYFYSKAAMHEKDSVQQLAYYKKTADSYKKLKDHANEALWLGKYYTASPSAGNVDLFNWGLAHYLGKNYAAADSVFIQYQQKFPAEEYGYYWSARANAAIDTSMEEGLAVPHYLKLIELLEKDSSGKAGLTKHLVEAYGYVAAYKANTEKDYETAVAYFEKLLGLDPGNNDAVRYVEILRKNIAKNEPAETEKKAPEN